MRETRVLGVIFLSDMAPLLTFQQNGTKQNKTVCVITESVPQLSFLYFLENVRQSMKEQNRKINFSLCFCGLFFYHVPCF